MLKNNPYDPNLKRAWITKPLLGCCKNFFSLRYFFLCTGQHFDLPLGLFLHCFPSFVFAAHLAFFAMLSPFRIANFRYFLMLTMHLKFHSVLITGNFRIYQDYLLDDRGKSEREPLLYPELGIDEIFM